MARVFYVHWNKGEALDSVRKLRSLNHVVRCHADCGPQACAFLQEWQPDLLVVSLAKLPAEGPHWTSMVRAAADFAKVPLIFASGNEDRVAAARTAFPDARFVGFNKLPEVIAALTVDAPAPVIVAPAKTVAG
jgi:CheY-like chemotaxis protein